MSHPSPRASKKMRKKLSKCILARCFKNHDGGSDGWCVERAAGCWLSFLFIISPWVIFSLSLLEIWPHGCCVHAINREMLRQDNAFFSLNLRSQHLLMIPKRRVLSFPGVFETKMLLMTFWVKISKRNGIHLSCIEYSGYWIYCTWLDLPSKPLTLLKKKCSE
jgi:hypothetical protein